MHVLQMKVACPERSDHEIFALGAGVSGNGVHGDVTIWCGKCQSVYRLSGKWTDPADEARKAKEEAERKKQKGESEGGG